MGNKAMRFCCEALSRANVEVQVRKLKNTRAGFIILLMGNLLTKCMLWCNEHIALHSEQLLPVKKHEMYLYVAVLLLSHCTGLSFQRSISLPADTGCRAPDLIRIRSIGSRLLAYPATGRGDTSSMSWGAQRDQTVFLSEFEKVSFEMSMRVFFSPSFTLATMDDDLYGTRATDNQVKTLSARKADREGHTADAIADSLFRITLCIRFRRRGEEQHQNVKKLLMALLDGRTGQSLCGFTVTADRGYGSMRLIEELNMQGVSAIFIMPEHLLRCHPFVGSSFLNVGREDVCEFDREEALDISEAATERNEIIPDPVGMDRPTAFVIEDDSKFGPKVCTAMKKLQPSDGETRRRHQVVAIAVRERPTKKFCKIIRFLYSVPPHISRAIDTWVAIPKLKLTSYLLFHNRASSGQVVLSTIPTDGDKTSVERFLLQRCNVKTIDQRCADWFLLRQFRVTGTSAGRLLLSDSGVIDMLGIEEVVDGEAVQPDSVLQRLVRS